MCSEDGYGTHPLADGQGGEGRPVQRPAPGSPMSIAQVGRLSLDQSRPRSSGLGEVVADRPDVGGLPGPAHGHVGQLTTTAVGEEVGPGRGGALGSVDGGGIAVAEAVSTGVFSARLTRRPSAVRRASVLWDVDGFDGGPLGGDERAVPARGQGDDLVTGPVGVLRGQTSSGPVSRPLVGHPVPGPLR